MDNTEIRSKKRIDIFNILIKKINRDNKNIYCDIHAMSRADIIENSLYRNCCRISRELNDKLNDKLNLKDIYDGINSELLVDKIEEKTNKCIYVIN